jgi:hypothetical protein
MAAQAAARKLPAYRLEGATRVNRQKWILFAVALLLMGGTAGVLSAIRAHQRLGLPGVKTVSTDDPRRLEVVLPEKVLDYTSESVKVDKMVLDFLPPDTSFGQRRYRAAEERVGSEMLLNVVLMGADRTSLHKPEFCLGGAGWKIDEAESREETVHIVRPQPYDLPVMKLMTTRQVMLGGQPTTVRGIYLYWFVADDQYTARHWQRMWWMARDLVQKGVLQRWAYVTCFSICFPGQEEAAFSRMKEFVASSVPEFQLAPPAKVAVSK